MITSEFLLLGWYCIRQGSLILYRVCVAWQLYISLHITHCVTRRKSPVVWSKNTSWPLIATPYQKSRHSIHTLGLYEASAQKHQLESLNNSRHWFVRVFSNKTPRRNVLFEWKRIAAINWLVEWQHTKTAKMAAEVMAALISWVRRYDLVFMFWFSRKSKHVAHCRNTSHFNIYTAKKKAHSYGCSTIRITQNVHMFERSPPSHFAAQTRSFTLSDYFDSSNDR